MGLPVFVMDMSKDFDCISHSLLIYKLKHYGCSDEVCKLIKSYLDERRQRVRIGEYRSNWGHLYKVVPQGSIL